LHLSLQPDFEIDAENGSADEWLHNEIVPRTVARFGKTAVLTVIDTDGSAHRYPLLSFAGDLALYGAWGKMRVAFGPDRLARGSAPTSPTEWRSLKHSRAW
jgi:hypothetical protein